jgi:hypothetical protein
MTRALNRQPTGGTVCRRHGAGKVLLQCPRRQNPKAAPRQQGSPQRAVHACASHIPPPPFLAPHRSCAARMAASPTGRGPPSAAARPPQTAPASSSCEEGGEGGEGVLAMRAAQTRR